MKPHLLFTILALFLTSPLFSQQTINGSFVHDGLLRDYILHLPPGYAPGDMRPLVINLHGNGSEAWQQQFYSLMDGVADTAGFMVVYPNGLLNTWNSGFPGNSTDDVGFISALIDTIHKNYGTDLERVYACGMSMGGFMSYRLACELDTRIAAIASVTGLMANPVMNNCSSSRGVPILQMHGTHDTVVPYAGTPFYASVDSAISFWAQRNQCLGAPIGMQLPDIVTTDSSSVYLTKYGPCDDASEVWLYRIDNGGHTWPGAPIDLPPLGFTNKDIYGSVEIWNFFKKFKHDNPVSSIHSSAWPHSIQVFPNPVSDQLEIETNGVIVEDIRILDMQGKMIAEKRGSHTGEVVVDLRWLVPGLYLLELKTVKGTLRKKILKK